MTAAAQCNFPMVCRQWRQTRKLSQLDLALAADVSQRHVSWLETGRSKPSREMVIRLSEAMEIPLRERNVLLQSAGFAAAYNESGLDAPDMAPVTAALRQVLDHHDPLPAFVVDRLWNVKMTNRAAELMLAIPGDPAELMKIFGDEGELNLALMTVHPRGFRPMIANWDQSAPGFIRRLQKEAASSGDRQIQDRFAEILAVAGPVNFQEISSQPLLPVIPIEFQSGELKLSLFSVISTFGTPQDVTTDELRVEAFYPTDEPTASFFRSQAANDPINR